MRRTGMGIYNQRIGRCDWSYRPLQEGDSSERSFLLKRLTQLSDDLALQARQTTENKDSPKTFFPL